MTSWQFVRDRLVVEPPRVELTILRPFIWEDGFLRREDLYTHPSHFTKRGTFLLDVSIGPAEHFNDSTLLTFVVHATLRNISSLPDKIQWLKIDFPSFTLVVSSLDLNRKGRLERCIHSLGSGILETFFVEVVLHLGDARMKAATNFNSSWGTPAVILDIIVTHHSAQSLIFRLVIWITWERGLEAALSPISRIFSFLAAAATHFVLEGGAILLKWHETSIRNEAEQELHDEFLCLHNC